MELQGHPEQQQRGRLRPDQGCLHPQQIKGKGKVGEGAMKPAREGGQLRVVKMGWGFVLAKDSAWHLKCGHATL